ncbi:amidohydrolase family protein [Blautia obeum]|uniref:amidohydrolase family protein n=1 Tax=Blautia obeum TaxID=40520 RepID=UPI00156DB16A|nr:amidohydrolase family protein [Blautia obeum]NSG40475.1 amidohydrolase family protein [Blautia obeum]
MKKIDMIICNGQVFDSVQAKFEKKDIGIHQGRFVALDEDTEADSKVDAEGNFVVPGLIDEHAHLNLHGTIIGANADTMCIPNGITTACDGGTCGASNFEQFYMSNIVRYEPAVYSYLNVSTFGNKSLCKHEEDHDPEDFREDLIDRLFEKYPEVLRGLKVRMCKGTLGNHGMSPLYAGLEMSKRLQEKGFHCPVAIHYDDLPDNVSVHELFGAMRKGDVIAHVFQTKAETIFDENGKIKDSVWEAKKRGVYMDDCHGRVHWSYPNLQNAFSQGFYPDIISSDLVRVSEYTRPGFSLLYAMSVNSAAGMPVEKILQSVTYTPAKALGIEEKAGQIRNGAPADVAILDIRDVQDKTFTDNYGNNISGNKLFVPLMTVRAGRTAYRQIFF